MDLKLYPHQNKIIVETYVMFKAMKHSSDIDIANKKIKRFILDIFLLIIVIVSYVL